MSVSRRYITEDLRRALDADTVLSRTARIASSDSPSVGLGSAGGAFNTRCKVEFASSPMVYMFSVSLAKLH